MIFRFCGNIKKIAKKYKKLLKLGNSKNKILFKSQKLAKSRKKL